MIKISNLRSSVRRYLVWAFALGCLAVVLIGVFYAFKSGSSTGENFSAVFVTNDQVYFGKIERENKSEVVLSHVYYLKATASMTNVEALNPEAQLSLIKLGDELHSPEDWMKINKQHVLFIEKMKPAGVIIDAIKKHETGK